MATVATGGGGGAKEMCVRVRKNEENARGYDGKGPSGVGVNRPVERGPGCRVTRVQRGLPRLGRVPVERIPLGRLFPSRGSRLH